MTAFTVGQRVRVVACDEDPSIVGMVGSVVGARYGMWPVKLDGDDGNETMLCDDEIAPDSPATSRASAALALAHAEARVIEARTALRDAVKAEITALPTLHDARSVESARACLCSWMGDPAWEQDGEFPEAGFCCWNVGRGSLTLHEADYIGTMMLTASSPHGVMGTQEYIRVTDGLDAAARKALLWLASHDCFVEVRS